MHHLSPRDEDRLDDLIDRVEGDLSRRNVLRRSSLRINGGESLKPAQGAHYCICHFQVNISGGRAMPHFTEVQ